MSCSEWREVKVSAVIEMNPRLTLKKGTTAKKISMKDLAEFNRKIQSYEITEFTSGTKFQNGDTLLARITPCLENGKTAYVDILEEGEVAFGSTEFIVLRAKPGITDDKFVYYFSISPDFRNVAIKSMTGSSGRQRVQNSVLANTSIKIPPLEEQKRIANILSSLDDKIELNNELNKTLEQIAQAIFKHWFYDFEFPNENGEPYKSSGGKFIDSELGLIPEGWKICNISDLCDISTKSVKPKEHENTLFEHYSIPAYDDSKFPVFEFGKEIKSNKYVVSIDSILVSKLNPTTKRVWDPVCITEQSICSTEFINYRPKNSKISSYVYCILNSDGFSEHLIQHATGSTGSRQRVKPKDTLSFTSLLPDTNTLYRFEGIIKPIREQIKLNHVSNWKLRELRDILLPKLMSGEIRVPEAEEVVESCLQKNN